MSGLENDILDFNVFIASSQTRHLDFACASSLLVLLLLAFRPMSKQDETHRAILAMAVRPTVAAAVWAGRTVAIDS